MICNFRHRIVNRARNGFDDYYLTVSCHRCYSCLSNRRRAWLFRLAYESLFSVYTLFITLTYNDDFCPVYLNKIHLHDFLRSLPFCHKYYAIGEYGPTTFRPHYHCVLFIKDCLNGIDLVRLIQSNWVYGFSATTYANHRRLNYILHYHTRPKNPFADLHTFSVNSNGLGRYFLFNLDGTYRVDVLDYIKRGGRVISDFNGSAYVIPRYYIRKLEDAGVIDSLPLTYDDGDDPLSVYLRQSANDVPLYRIADDVQSSLLRDLFFIDNHRMRNYNSQNKFLTAYV